MSHFLFSPTDIVWDDGLLSMYFPRVNCELVHVVLPFMLCFHHLLYTGIGVSFLSWLSSSRDATPMHGVKMTRLTAVQYIKFQLSTCVMGGPRETLVFFCVWNNVRILFYVVTEKLERKRFTQAVKCKWWWWWRIKCPNLFCLDKRFIQKDKHFKNTDWSNKKWSRNSQQLLAGINLKQS